MTFRLVQELADDGIDVAVACRVLKVSRSGFYEWRDRSLSARDLADAYLANAVETVHAMSRGSHGTPAGSGNVPPSPDSPASSPTHKAPVSTATGTPPPSPPADKPPTTKPAGCVLAP